MKHRLVTPKRRNPLVLPARQRLAGPHRTGPGALRQQSRRALQREIERLKPSP
ncbi:MAG: hypothetical protein KGJ24_03450 [Burkholderiales bacterium]|nr:hypothetical protein [Burkholderiales bacterium]MDE2565369.1 hypothetical protein [Burkholderiales bacterium]